MAVRDGGTALVRNGARKAGKAIEALLADDEVHISSVNVSVDHEITRAQLSADDQIAHMEHTGWQTLVIKVEFFREGKR